MNQLTKARYLTQHYQDLQGYRLLPFAAAFLLTALNAVWLNQAHLAIPEGTLIHALLTTRGLPLLLLLPAFLASHLIGKAYKQQHGRIKPAFGVPQAFSRSTYLIAAALYLACEVLIGHPAAGLQITWLWLLIHQPRPGTGLQHVPASTIYLLASLVIQATRPLRTEVNEFNYMPLITWSLIAAVLTTIAAVHNHRHLQAIRATQKAKETA